MCKAMGGIIKLWCCLKYADLCYAFIVFDKMPHSNAFIYDTIFRFLCSFNRNATFIYISRNRLFNEEISMGMCVNESWIDGDFIGNGLPTSFLRSYYEGIICQDVRKNDMLCTYCNLV